jgi:carboxyl-terminal processing protease
MVLFQTTVKQRLKRKQNRPLIQSFALVIGAILLFSGCQLKQYLPFLPQSAMKPPQQVYDQAWEALKEEYFDQSMNHQQWDHWRHHYDKLLMDNDDAYQAIHTMVASLDDQYTRFLPPREMKEQTIHIDSKLYGVGVHIAVKNGKLYVVAPLPGTPAEEAGLKSMDIILKVDEKATAALPIEEAADLIRGERGTYVSLEILRKNKQFKVKLMRDEIKIKSVFDKSIKAHPEIGYIRLNSFIGEDTYQDMVETLKKMNNKKGLIVDLRGNFGGLLSNAVEISDLFLENGEIVKILDRQGLSKSYEAEPSVLSDKPLVLLVDAGSASASEIFAGAMKDHHRATLVGTKTFGKGLVQKIVNLPDGSGMNITVSRYLTPNGRDIHKHGIQPDIEVHLSHKDIVKRNDAQLLAAVNYIARVVQ